MLSIVQHSSNISHDKQLDQSGLHAFQSSHLPHSQMLAMEEDLVGAYFLHIHQVTHSQAHNGYTGQQFHSQFDCCCHSLGLW
jgi:hypothetical protein